MPRCYRLVCIYILLQVIIYPGIFLILISSVKNRPSSLSCHRRLQSPNLGRRVPRRGYDPDSAGSHADLRDSVLVPGQVPGVGSSHEVPGVDGGVVAGAVEHAARHAQAARGEAGVGSRRLVLSNLLQLERKENTNVPLLFTFKLD